MEAPADWCSKLIPVRPTGMVAPAGLAITTSDVADVLEVTAAAPTVIIEFDNHYPPGRSSGPINHIHTVFREPGNDYGDLLRKHLMESPHHQKSK